MLLPSAAGVLVIQVCVLCARVLANTGSSKQGRATGEWGEWSSWTTCSADCNTGIKVRSRRCQHPQLLPVDSLLSTGDSSVWCSGSDKEIRLCNKQACGSGWRGWQEEECAKYDARVHAGQHYTWEPFIHPSDPCKLSCRAKGHHFYSNLAERVVDGTVCGGATSNPSAVCIQGVCKEVGCDEVVGSPWRRDACGVCKGDNSSCRTISGVFTSLDLSRGLNEMVLIPAGSTRINVTGLRYSINWLALQIPGGDYFLNGGISRSPDGDYEAAGTVFSYKTTKECYGQCIFAQGPTDRAVSLLLNVRGRNRGVMYSFNVPVNVTDNYFRRIINTTDADDFSSEQSSTHGHYDTGSNHGDDKDSLSSTVSADHDHDYRLTSNDISEAENEGQDFDADSQSVEDGDYPDESDEGFEVWDGSDDESDEEEEDAGEGTEEESDDGLDTNSVSIPLHSLVDPNEMDEDSIFNGGDKDQPSPDNDVTDTDYWPYEGGAQHSDGNNDDENDEEDSWISNSNPETAEPDVGAPEPLEEKAADDKSFKIIRKEKPRFIDADDNNVGSFANSAARNFEFQSNTRHAESYDEDRDASEDSSAYQAFTTASSVENSDQSETISDSFSDRPQQDGPTKYTPTSQPQHLFRPQSDRPTQQHHYQRTRSGSGQTKPWRRFRRPKYSQSFTFRRRHRQTAHAPATAQAPQGRGLSGEDRGSGHQRGGQTGRTRSTTYSAVNAPTSDSRPIRFRQPPQSYGSRGHGGTGSFSGYEQPSSVSRTPDGTSAYRRIANARGGGSGSHYSRHGSGGAPRRQALTLGRSVSRNQDGTVQLPASAGYNRGSPRDRTSAYDATARQHTREQDNLRLQRENARQQQEYSRQQEEYRRELLRRRQLFEQQKAAQNAEYQRRLEEHNRRMRQRRIEHQQRQQQQQQQHHHQRREHSHGRRQHDRQRHRNENQGREHRQQGRQPSLSLPSGGGAAASQAEIDGSGTYSLEPSGGMTTRQRTTSTRLTASSGHAGGSSAYPDNIREARDRRRQQGSVTTNRRQQGSARSEDTPRARVTPAPKTEMPVPPREGGTSRNRFLTTTPTPATRDFLTDPAARPVPATPPAAVPDTAVVGSPAPPQFIPADPRHGHRSSLTAAVSNQLPGNVDRSLLIGSEGNVVPNVIEGGLVIGGEDSISANEGQEQTPYEWRVSGLTECTLTCGGGLQQTVVVCLDTRTQAVVTDGNCVHVQRPKAKAVTCNTRPCPAQWQSSDWSSCSASCGPGQQTRLVTCVARISATLNMSMSDENCQGLTKPEARRVCRTTPCFAWRTGNWSRCSVQCGRGVRTRDVICVDHTGFDVSDDLCPGSKPSQEEACDLGPCGKGWYYTEWPEQCPAQCGSGSMARHVTCLGERGSPLPDSGCDADSRPIQRQSCRADRPCGGEWFTGEWEQCDVTCGRGHRQRDVVCVKALPGGLFTVVDEENCATVVKPETQQPCELDACVAEWYMTSWTQCSQSCGTGQRTREVKCLDPQQRPSSECPLADKPRSRESCNTHSCTARLPNSAGSDSDCQDSFSRCEIVRHARMCRYPYYRKKCCATCAEDT